MKEFFKPLEPFKFLFQYKKLLIVFLLFSTLVALAEGVGITTLIPLLDGIGNNSQSSLNLPFGKWFTEPFKMMTVGTRLQIIALVVAVTGLIRGMSLFISSHIISLLDLNVYIKVRKNAFNKLFHIDMQRFYGYEGGKLITIVESCTEQMSASIAACGQIIGAVILFTFHLILLLMISWKLSLVSGVIILFTQVLIKKILIKHLRTLSEKVLENRIFLNNLTAEVINGMKFIRLSSKEKKIIEKNANLSDEYTKIFKRQQRYYDLIVPSFSTSVSLVIAVLLFGAGLIFQQSTESIILVMLFLVIVTRLSGPVQIMLQSHSTILKNLCVFSEYDKFMQEYDVMENTDAFISFDQLCQEIKFSGVNFEYHNSSYLSLKNLSFSIPAKKTTALVGPSGSGKTTIINLLGKLFEPISGKIMVDGVDLTKINRISWLNKVGFVSQDVFLFNDSIKNNLKFMCERNITQEEIEQAASLAYAHEFILKLENGYDTYVGDRGVKLSGGQQQRLAIARAILLQPEILIFDEATSHLDSISEIAIQQAIDFFRKKCTIIIIAHRLSTIKNADQILVFEQGNLIQTGNHHSLLAEMGLYQELSSTQELYQL